MCPNFGYTESLFLLKIIPFNVFFINLFNWKKNNKLNGIICKEKRDSVCSNFGHIESLFSFENYPFKLFCGHLISMGKWLKKYFLTATYPEWVLLWIHDIARTLYDNGEEISLTREVQSPMTRLCRS